MILDFVLSILNLYISKKIYVSKKIYMLEYRWLRKHVERKMFRRVVNL